MILTYGVAALAYSMALFLLIYRRREMAHPSAGFVLILYAAGCLLHSVFSWASASPAEDVVEWSIGRAFPVVLALGFCVGVFIAMREAESARRRAVEHPIMSVGAVAGHCPDVETVPPSEDAEAEPGAGETHA